MFVWFTEAGMSLVVLGVVDSVFFNGVVGSVGEVSVVSNWVALVLGNLGGASVVEGMELVVVVGLWVVKAVGIVVWTSRGVTWVIGEVGGSGISVVLVSGRIHFVDSIAGSVSPISSSVVWFDSDVKNIVDFAVASVQAGSGTGCSVASTLQSVVRSLGSLGGLGLRVDSGVGAVALTARVGRGFWVRVVRVGRVSHVDAVLG